MKIKTYKVKTQIDKHNISALDPNETERGPKQNETFPK